MVLEISVFVDFRGGRGGLSPNNDDNFSAWIVCGEIFHELRERAIMGGIVDFRYFAAHRRLAVVAESLGKLFQRLKQPQWRLIENHGALLLGECREPGGSAFLLWQESLEAESVARQPRVDYCRDECRGAGKALHLDAAAAALPREQESGVGDCRGARVAHERYHLSALQPLYESR